MTRSRRGALAACVAVLASSLAVGAQGLPASGDPPSSGDTLWVTNFLSNKVTVLGRDSGNLTRSTVTVWTAPRALGVTRDVDCASGGEQRQVFVADWGSNDVPIFDAATRRGAPPGMPWLFERGDGQPAAIAISSSGSIPGRNCTLDTSTNVSSTVGTAYVANYGAGTVTPVPVATHWPEDDVRVGDGPSAIAVSTRSELDTVYVANELSGTISIIEGAANSRTARTIEGFTSPRAVAVLDTGTADSLLVADYAAGTVTLVTNLGQTETPTFHRMSGFNGPSAVLLAGPKVLVANAGHPNAPGSTVAVVDLADFDAVPPPSASTFVEVGTGPDALALSTDGSTAYVANYGPGTVKQIDLATLRPPSLVADGLQGPTSLIVVPPVQQPLERWRALVASMAAGKLERFDVPRTGESAPTTTTTFQVGVDPIKKPPQPSSIAFTPDATTAYVANYGDGTVQGVNVDSGAVTTVLDPTTNLPADFNQPNAIAIEPVTDPTQTDVRYAWVAGASAVAGQWFVRQVDMKNNLALPRFQVGSQPSAVAISGDGATAYVANQLGNSISVITGANTRSPTAGATIPGTGSLNEPFALALDAAGGKLFVANRGLNGNGKSTVAVLDLATGTFESGTVEVGVNAVALALAPAGNSDSPTSHKLYVANQGDGTVSVIDLAQTPPSVGSTLHVPNSGPAPSPDALFITPDQQVLYVGDYAGDKVWQIADPAGPSPSSASIDVTSPRAIAITPDLPPAPTFQVTSDYGYTWQPATLDASATTTRFGEIRTFTWSICATGGSCTSPSSAAVHSLDLVPATYQATLTADNESSDLGSFFNGQQFVRYGAPSTTRSFAVSKPGTPWPPVDITAALSGAEGPDAAIVTWVAPKMLAGQTITGYRVKVRSSNGNWTEPTACAATWCVVHGLTSGRRYTFTVAALYTGDSGEESSGESLVSNAVTPDVAPDAPHAVVATAGDAAAHVTWRPPLSDGGNPVTGYLVTSYPGHLTATVGPNATAADISGLDNGSGADNPIYRFTVVARTTRPGGEVLTSLPSLRSNPVDPGRAPGAPTNLAADPGAGKITVAWDGAQDNGSALTSYAATATAIGGSQTVTVTVAPTARSAVITGLSNGTDYQVSVEARNERGAAYATLMDGTQPATVHPRFPAALVVARLATGQAALGILDLSSEANPAQLLPGGTTDALHQPIQVAITPDARRAFITNFGTCSGISCSGTTIPILDMITHSVTGAIDLAAEIPGIDPTILPQTIRPFGIAVAPDGQRAYVSNYGAPGAAGHSVFVIDDPGGAPHLAGSINVGARPAGVALTPDGARMLVANYDSGTVSIVNLTTGASTAVSTGAGPYAISVTPNGRKAYVANFLNDSVSVLDLTTTIPVPVPIAGFDDPIAVAIAPDGAAAYVLSNARATITPINTATNAPGPDIATDSYPTGIAITPDGRYGLVSSYGMGRVEVFDLSTRALVKRLAGSYSGPFGLAIAPDQGPVARLAVRPAPPGEATILDATGSSSTAGSIASYLWELDDDLGVHQETATPVLSHVFQTAGPHQVKLTVTTTGGTSTAQVFTGQTMLRAGGASASLTRTVEIPASAAPEPPAFVEAAAGAGFAHVRWLPSAPKGSPVTSYEVTAIPGGAHATVAAALGGAVPTEATVSELADGTLYTFTVTARAGALSSDPSVESNAVLPGPRPTLVYVGNVTSNSVSVIDAADDTVVRTIPMHSQVGVGAVSPDGGTIYAVNFGAGTAVAIDAATGTVGPEIPVGKGPVYLALSPDGRKVYTTNFFSDTVTPIDTLTQKAGPDIPTGDKPAAVAFTPDGKKAYVPNFGYSSNSVSVIDTATDTVSHTIPMPDSVCQLPTGAAITPDGATVFIPCTQEGTLPVDHPQSVVEIDAHADTVSKVVTSSQFVWPQYIAVASDGRTAYVANNDAGTVSGIDVATGTVESYDLGGWGPQGVAVTPDGRKIYVCTYGKTFGEPAQIVTPLTRTFDAAGLAHATRGALIQTGYGPAEAAITPDQAPTASFTASLVPATTTVRLDATASEATQGFVAKYSWDFGDGTPPEIRKTGAPFEHVSTPGTHTITLTLTDSIGNTLDTKVYTGQYLSLNGGPQARTTRSVAVPIAGP